MLYLHKNRPFGFTLIELAIVLGIAGILFGGLWRLISTGNVQMRDQAAAAQQAQLVSAVNSYLQSSGPVPDPTGGGQTWLGTLTAGKPTLLPLPPNTAPAGSTGPAGCEAVQFALAVNKDPGLCSFLPPGFSSSTTNPYGQTYAVSVITSSVSTGQAQTYSFMILTLGGDTIPDTSGGRISAMIGGDGGFIYSATGVCPFDVCGSYGSWSVASATYFPAALGITPQSGRIASRTYYSPMLNSGSYWLARTVVPGDQGTFAYNTMQTSTDLYLGGNNFYFNNPAKTAAQAGTINMEGGTINGNGTINMFNGPINMGGGDYFPEWRYA